jgi:hypothetical protein
MRARRLLTARRSEAPERRTGEREQHGVGFDQRRLSRDCSSARVASAPKVLSLVLPPMACPDHEVMVSWEVKGRAALRASRMTPTELRGPSETPVPDVFQSVIARAPTGL